MTTTLVPDVELTGDVLALIAAQAAASDESGHLDPAVVAALAATGINRLLLPVELGGFAASPRRAVELVEQIAAVDGSTAWAAAIGFGTNLFAGYVPPDGAAEVFADPDQSNAAMFAPLGEVTEAGDGSVAPHRTMAVHEQLRAGGLDRARRSVPGRARTPPGVRAAGRG